MMPIINIVRPLWHNFWPINYPSGSASPTATRSFPVSKIDLNGLFAPQMVLVLPECAWNNVLFLPSRLQPICRPWLCLYLYSLANFKTSKRFYGLSSVFMSRKFWSCKNSIDFWDHKYRNAEISFSLDMEKLDHKDSMILSTSF